MKIFEFSFFRVGVNLFNWIMMTWGSWQILLVRICLVLRLHNPQYLKRKKIVLVFNVGYFVHKEIPRDYIYIYLSITSSFRNSVRQSCTDNSFRAQGISVLRTNTFSGGLCDFYNNYWKLLKIIIIHEKRKICWWLN